MGDNEDRARVLLNLDHNLLQARHDIPARRMATFAISQVMFNPKRTVKRDVIDWTGRFETGSHSPKVKSRQLEFVMEWVTSVFRDFPQV